MPRTARRFTSDPISVVEARQLVEAAVDGCPEEIVGDAALLTTELVSNAVLHAGTSFDLSIERMGDRLRVTVSDGSPEPPRQRHPAPDEVGGRGLLLVDALSSRWGHERQGTGKAVWFELDLPT